MTATPQTYTLNGPNGAQVVDSEDGQAVLVTNLDLNNTIFLSNLPSVLPGSGVQVVPLAPQGFIVFDGTVDYYAATQQGQTASVAVIPGASAYFQTIEIIAKIIEIKASAGNGLFVYDGSNHLIAAAVGAAGKDPSGLYSVSPVLAAGQWNNSTGVPGAQSMVDSLGDLTVQGADGVARFRLFTGADGIHDAGSAYWFNDFGAVIQIIDPVVRAVVQYQDRGSATQGGVLGAQVAATVDITDPVTGVVLHPGITIIDPVFGDNLSIQGDVVGFDQLGMTRKCFISSQDPAAPSAVGPFLQVDAPEHTQALHWQGLYFGKSSDGTTPPKAIFTTQSGNGNPPVVNTKNFLELQPVSGQGAISVFLAGAANGINVLDAFVPGDTNARFSIGLLNNTGIFLGPGNAAEDTNLYRSLDGSNPVLKTDQEFQSGGLNIPANAGAHFGVDNTGLLFLIGTPAGQGRLGTQVVGDALFRFQIDTNGKQQWGDGTHAVDTDLFRQAAGELKTDGQFDCSILFASSKAVLANQGSAPAAIAGDTQMVGSNADQMFTVGANGTSGFVQVGNSDTTQYTVTAASAQAISNAWNIPAGAANAGAIYQVKAFGHGKQGSTQQALTITFVLNGGAVFTATLPAAFAVANANFGFDVELKIMIATTGVSGTMWAEMRVTGAASVQVGALLAAQIINTTVGNNVGIDAQWGSTTGAPTITSNGNYFQKIA